MSTEKRKIRPRKKLGQNFLVCPGVAGRMVRAASIAEGDRVLEVGPGRGALTGPLLETGAHVLAVEKDGVLADRVRTAFKDDGLEVVEGDFLEVADKLDSFDRVVSNLPFNVSKEVVRRLLERDDSPRLMVLLVQKEVAESMAAAPPRMDLLSVSVQFYAEAEVLFTVPRSCFRPQPKVEGAVVKLVLKDSAPSEEDEFFRMVRAGFAHRRKKLSNNLEEVGKEEVEGALREMGLSSNIRAEALSVNQWLTLIKRVL